MSRDRPVSEDELLGVRDLSTRFFTEAGQVNAVESVSFDLRDNEILGIVGESGSGKSVTALSLIDLVETPGRVTDGEVWYRDADLAEEFRDAGARVDGDHVDLRTVPSRVRRSLRGSSFSMIFQDPMSSFNPSITVGEQIAEAVEVQRRARANPRSTRARTQGYGLGNLLVDSLVPGRGYVDEESEAKAIELLEQVGIPDPAERADEYPNQFSGGMLQRAMIAQALAGEPDLLIADEPTTALDVVTQAQILRLLADLQAERDLSVLFVTHDLGVVSEVADRVVVVYAGHVMERGPVEAVLEHPAHPYTRGLLASLPGRGKSMEPLQGSFPDPVDRPDGCLFHPRCPHAVEECSEAVPPEHDVSRYVYEDRSAACVYYGEGFDATDLDAPADEPEGDGR
jgi:peptide/nickel transport system ATP-binding protein